MRQIGALASESSARLFGDFLYVRGIDNQVEFDQDHGWTVWIVDEEHLDRARQLLTDFQANPNHPSFRAQAAAAAEAREQARKDEAAYAAKMKSARQAFAPLYGFGFGPATVILMVACIVVAILSSLGDNRERIMALFITNYEIVGAYIKWMPGLPEIRHGEIWRLFTPIFIHFGFLHIVFNLLWLRDLGSALEHRHGSIFLCAQVLVIAAISNLAQFYVGGAPNFGGMSGVVYGLLGYIWIRGKCDPFFGMALHPTTVTMMVIWFFLCWSGLMGNIANWCHTAGLLVGMAWGYLSALKPRR